MSCTGQVHACLSVHLPVGLRAALPAYPNSEAREKLLDALSDGQMLCEAYNAVLRKSQRPWGFIPSSSVHDVHSLTRARSTEYPVQAVPEADRLHVASSSSSDMRRSPSSDGGVSDDGRQLASGQPKVGMTFRRAENLRVFAAALKLRYLIQLDPGFDVRVVARREPGWTQMLEDMATQWVQAAAHEKREEEPDSA